MRIGINPSALLRTRWYEYAIRFLLGGAITAIAGLIARYAGPVFGGLFLAFPAILPAGMTLIEKHEREKKQHAGLKGMHRGAQAAGLDAAGAAIGSIGLIAFAVWIWRLLPRHSAGVVLASAMVIWFAVSLLVWQGRKLVRIG